MRLLRNITRPLAIVALAVTPVVAVSCGSDSSSNRSSDEEFCAKLIEIEASNALNLEDNDPEVLKEMLTVFADLAKTAPTDDLKKAFDAMDRERCIMILEGYGVGLQMVRLIKTYWRDAIMVCRASGNYGQPFKAGRGVTQGGPLSAKLFNILVDAVVRELFWQLREEGEYEGAELDELRALFRDVNDTRARGWIKQHWEGMDSAEVQDFMRFFNEEFMDTISAYLDDTGRLQPYD